MDHIKNKAEEAAKEKERFMAANAFNALIGYASSAHFLVEGNRQANVEWLKNLLQRSQRADELITPLLSRASEQEGKVLSEEQVSNAGQWYERHVQRQEDGRDEDEARRCRRDFEAGLRYAVDKSWITPASSKSPEEKVLSDEPEHVLVQRLLNALAWLHRAMPWTVARDHGIDSAWVSAGQAIFDAHGAGYSPTHQYGPNNNPDAAPEEKVEEIMGIVEEWADQEEPLIKALEETQEEFRKRAMADLRRRLNEKYGN